MTIDPKQLAEAIAIVKRHQDWRRGAEIEMENPKELGVAIDETLEAAKAHLAHLETGGWLDIETAPKDGSYIMCCSLDSDVLPYIAWWGTDPNTRKFNDKEWLSGDGDDFSTGYYYTPVYPTHWMPLHKPPTNTKPPV